MKAFVLAAALTAFTMPAMAGGLVMVEDDSIDEPMEMVNPNKNDWVIPVIIGGIVLCAVLCGGGDEAVPVVVEPPGPPKPICYSDC